MGLLPDTQNRGLRMRRECRERFPQHRLQRKPLVSDPGMHHGTCVTHVPWYMSGSLTRVGGKKNVPGIPGMRNPQFCVSRKMPVAVGSLVLSATSTTMVLIVKYGLFLGVWSIKVWLFWLLDFHITVEKFNKNRTQFIVLKKGVTWDKRVWWGCFITQSITVSTTT